MGRTPFGDAIRDVFLCLIIRPVAILAVAITAHIKTEITENVVIRRTRHLPFFPKSCTRCKKRIKSTFEGGNIKPERFMCVKQTELDGKK
jgi:hypothetical protein